MEKLPAGLFLGSLLLLYSLTPFLTISKVSAKLEPLNLETDSYLLQPVRTLSEFSEKIEKVTFKVDPPVKYVDDPEMEVGDEKIIQSGEEGKVIKKYQIIYHLGQEYSRNLISQEFISPKEKIISRGTKIVWRTLQTPEGEIRYWRKLRVWATHYDSKCPGCDEWTAIGLKQGKGVIAVDPKVIKLRTRVYIPGYGLAIAGDTGGAIKGNVIDLGFEDAKTAGWSARYVDIYLLD